MTKTKNIIDKIESCYDKLIGVKFGNFIITSIDHNFLNNINGTNYYEFYVTVLNFKTNVSHRELISYINERINYIYFLENEHFGICRVAEYLPSGTPNIKIFDINNKEFI